MTKSFNVAIAGATGIVGATLLSILAERHFPINHLYLLASARSAGEKIIYKNSQITVLDIAEFDFAKSEISFFCVSNALAQMYVPKATAAGNIVLDKSSQFRYDYDVPLIVPEVNISELSKICHD